MNQKKNRIFVGCFAVWVGLEVTVVAQTHSPSAVGDKPPQSDNVASTPAKALQDPFAMQPYSGDMLLPASDYTLPEGIQVVGILSLKSGVRTGVLKIPGAQDYHFVREGDLVQIQQIQGQKQLYLQIQAIHSDTIEIAPYTRPEEVRIYR